MRLLISLLLFSATLNAGDVRVGETVWQGGRWFQFAGLAPGGERLWLYPHLDGVPEIFTESVKGPWSGSLDSRFDPSTGRFENLFNAADAASEILYGALAAESKRPAARVLSIFLKLYDQPLPPYYLRPHLNVINAALTDDDLATVAKAVALQREIISRLDTVGTRITSLQQPRATRDAGEYYRRLISDGYLDLTAAGGNLYAEAWGTYNSWRFMEDFTKRLKKQGFRDSRFRAATDAVLFEKTVRLLDTDVVVRIFATGGSKQPARVLRSVASFTEGFARADVLLYHGHSNKDEGAYYLSESSEPFPRFQIGMHDTRDLFDKLQGLNRRAHQIYIFQSCISVEKYGYPIRAALDARVPNTAGHTGFIGNPYMSQQVDFAPRFSVFVEELCLGHGPRDIALRLNSIRPEPQHTLPLIFRGVLQPRTSYIVPPGVTLSTEQTVDRDSFQRTESLGSDGITYTSTDLFAQNAPGEIVQVVPRGPAFFGLTRDGILYEVSTATHGAMAPCAATRNLRAKIIHLCADPVDAERLLLLCDDNSLRALSYGDTSLQHARIQPPAKIKFTAIAYDTQKNFIAQTTSGEMLAWNPEEKKFKPANASIELIRGAPSLTVRGLTATLICKE